jgi:predicted Rossmann fold flavoprotein
MWNTAVIGGGAAGMVAAISAASQGQRVILFEKGDKLGKKILISGNGRCNLTNISADDIRHYHGAPPSFMRAVLSHFPVRDTLAFFADLGVEVHEEKRGRLFPRSNQAQSVVDVLADRMAVLGVEVCLETEITSIEPFDVFYIKTTAGTKYATERVVMASGGISAPKMGADRLGMDLAVGLGHELTELLPGLVALESKEKYLKAMQGVKVVAEVGTTLGGRESIIDHDDLLIAAYGVSGFTILNLSARIVPQLKRDSVDLEVNLFPTMTAEALSELLKDRWSRNGHRTLLTSFSGLLNSKLIGAILRHGGFAIDRSVTSVSKEDRWRLAKLLTQWKIPVFRPRGFEYAEVTIGGIKTNAINPNTLESYIVPGLYFAGEMLEVHGDLGGFNFQWAWASGMLAGKGLGD